MPIKGLTDKVEPRFGSIGKLRKGDEKVSDNKPGKELDYWRFTSDNPEIEQAFIDAFGEKPRNVQVYIPFATSEEAFTTWCEVWTATSLQHRCDGENAFIWLEDGCYKHGSKPCPGGHTKDDALNDVVGRLSIIIPQLVEAGYVGYVTMETHGKHDILSISRTLQAVYQSRQNNPLGLRGVMFNLRRVEEKVSVPGFGAQSGKRAKVTKWNVKLEPAADWVRLQLEMAHNETMLLDTPKQLPAEVIDADIIPLDATVSNIQNPTDDQQRNTSPDPSMSAFNDIGSQLWPGDKWAEVKAQIGRSKNGDLETMLKFVTDRIDSIHADKNLSDHIDKAWPGLGRIVPIVREIAPDARPLDIIAGVVKAAAIKAKDPKKTDDDLADIVLTEIPMEMTV